MNIRKFNFLGILCICALLFSCSNCDEVIENFDSSLNQENITSVMYSDTNTYFINSEQDLQELLNQVNQRKDDSLKSNGWKEYKEDFIPTRGKVKVRIDTVYQNKLASDGYSDPSVYAPFTAKFGQQMVDEINLMVNPKEKLSTKKKYKCQWVLYLVDYKAKLNEKFASRPSPRCALVPSSKSEFIKRGYSVYVHEPTQQYQMWSYQLIILHEDVKNKTIFIGADWPFKVRNPKGPGEIGYEFIYAVISR
jgi:hypothetical protein